MPGTDGAKRSVLTRDKVLATAVEIADADGLSALTMRSLAQSLGVQPMSLYHHVRDKSALLDGLVDVVFAEIEMPHVGAPWRTELRRRSLSARAALRRHPWALALLETRSAPGPATLAHHDAMLGTFRGAGFSLTATGLAYALLDAFVYGFALQEVSMPFTAEDAGEMAAAITADFAVGAYPHLAEFAAAEAMRPGYDFSAQFEPGLDRVLDSIAALLGEAGSTPTTPPG